MSDEQNSGPPPASAVPTSASSIPAPASAQPSSAGPSSAGPTPGAATAARAPRRGRRILLIVAIVVAFLLLLGGTIGVVAYDRATAIDRSTPDVVAQQFMQAATVDRDAARVGLFVCASWPVADAMNAAKVNPRPDLRVKWEITSLTSSGQHAAVDLRVLLLLPAGGGDSFGEVRPWHLSLVQEDGWRVCGLEIGPPVHD